MKIKFIALIATVALISSCSKTQQEATEEDISVSQVSERITGYVDNNYPDAYIYSASRISNSQARTIITLNSTEELAFDQNDNYLGNGEHFHGIRRGHGHGGDHGHGHGHCHGFEHGDFDHIPLDSLSPAITGYVASNYAGYTIKHAEKDSLCSIGNVIEIMVDSAHTVRHKLIFDTAGNYLMTASRTNYSSLPAAVQNSVSSNYAGYTPRNRSQMLTLAGGQVQYVVYLFNGTTHKRVILSDTGTVICEQ